MQVETTEVLKPKVKKKSTWMKYFHISKPLDDLEKAQLETRSKIVNDFKQRTYRR
jgi:hypothetical protein